MALAWSGVERDENLEQALRRELLEESGIELTRKPCLHGIFSNFERSAGDHIAVYVFRDWTRVCAFSSGPEIIENKFFELESLPNGLIGGAKRRLFEVFDRHPLRTFRTITESPSAGRASD
jgi:ADP-ribose pyrophosphatase YjhB (NUDIX family)